ncbi:MAG TPA: hypothetical protein VJU14_05785 [Solirubrobacterales bacterium]|nr:hypothetical protein [Solirubrobacterales bacterium]
MPTMAPPEDALTERFARIDERFDDVNRRFNEVDLKFDDVNRRFNEVDLKFEQVNQRITEHKEETNRRFDRVEGDIGDLKKSVASIQESVASIQATLTRMSFGLALTFASVLITKGF